MYFQDLRVTAGSNLISPTCGKIYSHELLVFKLAIPANILLGVAPCCHSYDEKDQPCLPTFAPSDFTVLMI